VLNSIFQGIIQGVSEFLPVSSSGHLVLFQHFTKSASTESNLLMTVMLHLATLLAVIYYYRATLKKFVTPSGWKEPQTRRLALLIVFSSVPTALIGLFFQDYFESLFSSPLVVSVALFITGLLLMLAEKMSAKLSAQETVSLENMPFWKGLLVGVAQGLAITPGISRSGSTLSAGLLLKLDKEDAGNFAFLLMIPSVGGAALLKGLALFNESQALPVPLSHLLAGMLAAAVSGFFSLKLLMLFIKKQNLSYFSYYLFAVSTVSFILIKFMGK